MSTGQHLVSLSPLPSGTALAHLLALTQGPGPGATVFASRMTVTLTTERMSVTEKPRKQAQQVVEPAVQPSNQKSKNAYVRTRIPQFQVLTPPDEVWVRTNRATI